MNKEEHIIIAAAQNAINYFNDDRYRENISALYDAAVEFNKKYLSEQLKLINSTASESDNVLADIVGYVSDDGCYVKYNRKTKDFLIYNPQNNNISFKCSADEKFYENIRGSTYSSELP